MKDKLIVFDMDDIMWNLNDKAAKIAGIDPAKMTIFSAYDNKNLTESERQRLLSTYAGTELFKDIKFIKPVIRLINYIYNNYKQYDVRIISNCASSDIRDIKMPQLLNVLDIPKDNIYLNVIDMETQSMQKKLPDNIFIFVDDSPHNIILGDAVHRIMPAKSYNDVLVNGYLNGFKIERPLIHELNDIIMKYIYDDLHQGR